MPGVRPRLAYDPLTPLRDAFLIPQGTRKYTHQFANVYFMRLTKLKPKVRIIARERWGRALDDNAGGGGGGGVGVGAPEEVDRVLEVTPGKLCYIIGTVYCDMKLKPNVLEDLAREHYLAPPPILHKWISPNGGDSVMLEDESGRVKLVGLKPEWTLVTGIIVGVLGSETRNGDFEVLDVIYPGLPPPLPRSLIDAKGKSKSSAAEANADSGAGAPSVAGEDAWVALVSGLDLQGAQGRPEVRSQLLAEWINGEVGGEEDLELSRKVARLIIAGNGFGEPERETDAKKPKRYGYDASTYSAAPSIQLDRLLSELLPTVDVDLMPGEQDPTGTTVPQQPLHGAMFPLAGRFEGFRRQPGIWWGSLGGAAFLGTSGQNLDDVFRYLESEDRLGMAMSMLEWRHIAPTAPDTLWCYPFKDLDPFIMNAAPDVFFIGNQPSFATGLCHGSNDQKVRVILTPRFSDTGVVVLVNPRTLEVRTVRIGGRSMPDSGRRKKEEGVREVTRIEMEDDDDD